MALRAEPAAVRDHALLGFIFIFIFDDLRPARQAAAARQQLQAALALAGRAAQPSNLTPGHALVGAIAANANLATMAITAAGAAPTAGAWRLARSQPLFAKQIQLVLHRAV